MNKTTFWHWAALLMLWPVLLASAIFSFGVLWYTCVFLYMALSLNWVSVVALMIIAVSLFGMYQMFMRPRAT